MTRSASSRSKAQVTFQSCLLRFLTTRFSAETTLTAELTVEVTFPRAGATDTDIVRDRFRVLQSLGGPEGTQAFRVDTARSRVMGRLDEQELARACEDVLLAVSVHQRRSGTRFGFFPPRTVSIPLRPPGRRSHR